MIVFSLPDYAVRYLAEMCKRDREYLAATTEIDETLGLSLGILASYGSLNIIESSIPAEFEEAQRKKP